MSARQSRVSRGRRSSSESLHTSGSRTRHPQSRKLRLEALEDRHLLSIFTVNSAGDVDDGDPDTTTLRQAINAANALPGEDQIKFNISGDGPHTI